jgi:hypothetical protein
MGVNRSDSERMCGKAGVESWTRQSPCKAITQPKTGKNSAVTQHLSHAIAVPAQSVTLRAFLKVVQLN